MRISDWSSDVCSSDLIAGQNQSSLRRTNVQPTLPRNGFADLSDCDIHASASGVASGRFAIYIRFRDEASTDQCLRSVQFGLGKARIGAGDLNLSRSEEHTSELQSLMRISYAVFCLKKKK